MFPDDDINELILKTKGYTPANENTKNALGIEPQFDFETGQFIVHSGEIKLITEIKAIKQWIKAFFKTAIDTFYIYKNIKYGTSEKRLIGQKSLYDSGFTISEIEREIKQGLKLNPAIKNVLEVEFSKDNEILNIDITVQLFNGELIKVSSND